MSGLDEQDFRQLHEQIEWVLQAGRKMERSGHSRGLSLCMVKLQEAAFWCDEGFREEREKPIEEG